MIPSILTPLRRVACFLFLHAVLAHTALAAPATTDSMLKYFAIADAPAMAARAVDTIEAAKAKEWQDETDPVEKAKKKARFERVAALIRKHITWKAIEPIMLESFRRHLQEEDVLALIAYGQSPGGRVYFEKLAPAMVQAMPPLMAYLDQRIDEISDRQDGKATAGRPVWRKPAEGTKAALAYTLLLEFPGARQEFTTRMAAIEANMLNSLRMFSGPEHSNMRKELQAMAATVQREISYEEIAAFQSQLILDSVTESELALLIADRRKPELRRLLAKQKLAERDATDKGNKVIVEKLLPKLMAELAADSK